MHCLSSGSFKKFKLPLLGTFGALLVLSGCSEPAPQQKDAPAPAVSVYQVKTNEIGDYREFVARTEAYQQADLRARVEGELVKRNFTEGTIVEQGQLLLEIDPSEYKAKGSELEASLQSARAAAQRAKKDLDRGKEISKDGFISQADLDKLSTNFDQLTASVASSKAALEQAKISLSYTQIYAPFDGLVGKVNYDVGNIVGPSSGSLAELTNVNPIFVNFQVEEADYINFKQAHAGSDLTDVPFDITLRLPNDSIHKHRGKLNFADVKTDQSTGTVELRAEFENPDNVIMPGLFVTLIVESQDKQALVLIPQMAVQENQQGKFVLVVGEDNTAQQRFVDLGRRIEAMWVVKGGLEQGEKVIIEGLQKVRPGVAVKAVEKTINPITGALDNKEQ